MTVFWGGLTLLGYMLTLALVPSVFLRKKENPASTVAWILAIILLPYLGGLFYLVFGINRVARRAKLKRQARLQIGERLPELSQYYLLSRDTLAPPSPSLARLAIRVGGTRPTFGNHIELFNDTNRTFGRIAEAVMAAERSLHLEYYIWQPDETGRRLRDLLIERARAGVKVRFLYDGLGSWLLDRRFLKPMLDAGIEVASFLPGKSWRTRWSINLRSHRKIIVVDGRVGFTGGMNIGDEYLGKDKSFGFWRDTHLQITGPAVLQLQQVFVEDWYFATGAQLTSNELFPKPDVTGDQVAQVLASGPDGELSVFHLLFFAAITEARESVTLVTSYFVPPPPLITAMETAALRGVKVRVLVSRINYMHTVLAGRSYYESLLKCGVEIYEYTKGAMHSRTITIDGLWSVVGTPNLDSRSLYLNFEDGVVLYDPRMAHQLEEHFEEDIKSAQRIDPAAWGSRPFTSVLAENICRLFSPVL